jgi:FkbM family methyltransferase
MRIALPVPLPITVNGSDRLVLPMAHRGLRTYEPDAWGAFLNHIRPGDTLVDVGANLGLYTVAAAKRGARVIAVEPDPANVRQIRRNARLNRVEVAIVEVLAGAQIGTAPLALRGSPVSGSVDMYLGPTTRYAVAAVLTLDALLKDERVDLLKIDVEGAEIDVLRGAEQTLRDKRPRAILIEVHPPSFALIGQTLEDLTGLIDAGGYDRCVLWKGGGAERWLATPSRRSAVRRSGSCPESRTS